MGGKREPLPTPCVARGRLSECFALTRAGAAGGRGTGKHGNTVGANRFDRRGGGRVLLMLGCFFFCCWFFFWRIGWSSLQPSELGPEIRPALTPSPLSLQMARDCRRPPAAGRAGCAPRTPTRNCWSWRRNSTLTSTCAGRAASRSRPCWTSRRGRSKCGSRTDA